MSGKTRSVPREYVESIIIAIILAFIIRTFVVQLFKIPSGSMEDTLLVGDYPVVNKFLYGLKIPITGERVFSSRDIKRGDVIVFKYPKEPDKDYIKRVVGLPGDEIRVANKMVYINGELFVHPHEIHKDPETFPPCPSGFYGDSLCKRDNMEPLRVPENAYFVMGDNRDRSADSRFWGFVPEENVKGKAFMKLWSVDGPIWAVWQVRWDRVGRLID